jgi:hypothetical protein
MNIQPQGFRTLSAENPIQSAIHDRVQPECAYLYMAPDRY